MVNPIESASALSGKNWPTKSRVTQKYKVQSEHEMLYALQAQ